MHVAASPPAHVQPKSFFTCETSGQQLEISCRVPQEALPGADRAGTHSHETSLEMIMMNLASSSLTAPSSSRCTREEYDGSGPAIERGACFVRCSNREHDESSRPSHVEYFEKFADASHLHLPLCCNHLEVNQYGLQQTAQSWPFSM